MTLEEAIEILDTLLNDYNIGSNYEEPCPNQEGAITLGIEALNREREYRVILDGRHQQLLPGETKEAKNE